MTREEAKSELMQIYMSLSEEKKKALDVLMAQTDGEYIRRSDVIKAVDKHTIDTSEIVLDEDITVILEELPSVAIPSAEPKTGHWIDNHNNTISCDYCHTWFKKDDRYGYMHYCPYCNTKMVEPQESEDKE